MKNKIIKLFFIVCIVTPNIMMPAEMEEERQSYSAAELFAMLRDGVNNSNSQQVQTAIKFGANTNLPMMDDYLPEYVRRNLPEDIQTKQSWRKKMADRYKEDTPVLRALRKNDLSIVKILAQGKFTNMGLPVEDSALEALIESYTDNHYQLTKEAHESGDAKTVLEIIECILRKGKPKNYHSDDRRMLATFIAINELNKFAELFHRNFHTKKLKNSPFAFAVLSDKEEMVRYLLNLKIVSSSEVIKSLQVVEKEIEKIKKRATIETKDPIWSPRVAEEWEKEKKKKMAMSEILINYLDVNAEE